ncbi:glycosyltransferase [Limosilactobacillus secaliphilus]|uniref:Glycosyl transferase, family 8 n=1 Tax=Limosilactobacillus secaliphilus TaxID=396268 RepID=A0A0R2I2D7_9LACO|nr:glycosyltransferase [Limosilactobacillus secaliphilus]KRN59051.1 glycosyl transferase, family 8 [Limosilactobacillus secaliphilus]
MKAMNIVLIAKWESVSQLETCIKSVAYHNSEVNYYVLNNDIAQEWFFHLNQLLKPFDSQLIDIKLPSDQLNAQLPVQIKLGQIPQLAHLDKALFLSLDALVTDNLAGLYHYQLGEKLWAVRSNQQTVLVNLQAVRQNAFLQQNQLSPESFTGPLADKVTELGCDLPAKFISNSGDSAIQLLDQPWNDEIDDHNQLWWQFFATDWPIIQQKKLLIPAQDLVNAPEKVEGQENRMQFIMAANYNYQPAFLTTIKSLLFHNQNIDIHLINPDIPQTWFNAINRQIWPSRLIDVKISPDKLNVKDVQKHSAKELSHVNNMTNALLYLHELIHCPRAIYLDSDVIVNRNLRPFYDLDLKGHPLAACRELFIDPLINVGVMLLDLDKLRTIPNLTSRMIDYYQHHEVSTASESVITHFFFDQYLELNFTYGYQTGSENGWSYLHDFKQMDRYLPQCYCLHYVTGDKPWKMLSVVRHRQLWWANFDLSWAAIKQHHLLPIQTKFTSPYQVMICTGDQTIENFEKIVQATPDIEFNVTAHTPVGFLLKKMIAYPNVHVFPEVLMPVHQQLAQRSSLILDIGYGNKDDQLLKAALEDGKFVMSFKNTQASSNLTSYPNYLVFNDDSVQEFIDTLKRLVVYGDLSN